MNDEDIQYQTAKKKVEEIKGFYIHVAIFVLINLGLFLLNIFTTPDILWFYWPLGFWTLGLLAHAIVTFGIGNVLGDDWEERKIRELMDKK